MRAGAVMVLSGRSNAGAEAQAQADAAGFAASVTAGLLSVTARRELGDWVPMLRVETGPRRKPCARAAGFDASRLIPPFLDGIAKGAYVEGIVGSTRPNGTSTRGSSVGLGVRLELSFPKDLVTSMGYGPGPGGPRTSPGGALTPGDLEGMATGRFYSSRPAR